MWELDHKEGWVWKNWCVLTLVLEKTLDSSLNCKEIKPVNPKGNSSWIFIGRLMLKLKLQYFGHLMRRIDSFEKTLMLGKFGGRRRGWQRMRWVMASLTQCTWIWASSRSWWWTGKPGVLHSLGSQRFGDDWATELNWGLTWQQQQWESDLEWVELNLDDLLLSTFRLTLCECILVFKATSAQGLCFYKSVDGFITLNIKIWIWIRLGVWEGEGKIPKVVRSKN